MQGWCTTCHRYCDGEKRFLNGHTKPIPDSLTKHHVFPERHFGKVNNYCYLFLCFECHNELERKIAKEEKKLIEQFGNSWDKFFSKFQLRQFYKEIAERYVRKKCAKRIKEPA